MQNQKIFLTISLILELENFYQKKERNISLSCLKNMIDLEHLNQINEDFDEYPDNDGLEDTIGDEGMQNLNNGD